MKALHGPWKIESEQMCASVIDADGDPVCYCDCGDAAQDEINARAIAVLPEMYEALQRAEQLIKDLGYPVDSSITRALAKAEGA